MKKTIMIAALALTTLSAIAKDVKTVVFTTQPQMHCQNCEKKIKQNVRYVKGVKQIQTNVEKQTVTIQYDADKTTPAKIKEGFKKIGYEVKEVSSTPQLHSSTTPQLHNSSK